MKYQYWLVLLLKIFISVVVISLLFLPYAFTLKFTGIEDNAEWGYLYLWEDEILLAMFVPFFLLWPWYLLQKKKWQIIVLSVLSFLYLGNSLGSLVLLMQDFVPSAGVVLAGSLFPCLVLLYFLTRKKNSAVQLQEK